MIDEEENQEPKQKAINPFHFFKYEKEMKIQIIANIILQELNYPIIDEDTTMECIKTYKLEEMDDTALNKRFVEYMKYQMFPQLKKGKKHEDR